MRSSAEVISILRGLAFSATGMRRVSTPLVVVGGDALGVEGVAEEQLAGEGAQGALGNLHLDLLAGGDRAALGLDRQHVLLDVQLDGVLGHARQVEADHELLALAPGVQRHRVRARPGAGRGAAQQLRGEPVQFTERVGAHQHG